jgi:hypothetical protein
VVESQAVGSVERDHLFISYASEDGAFAEWLTLKLTAKGFQVWCDRVKLLGGESYPRDIDTAIKERTFRVLAVLSHKSISKPNSMKERTLALNISRERSIDFIIPLNIDGLKGSELDWMTSDLVYISFYKNWSSGLNQLLKKLSSIGAPKPLKDGRILVQSICSQNTTVIKKHETIVTNLLEVQETPSRLLEFEFQFPVTSAARIGLGKKWAFYTVNKRTVLAFSRPTGEIMNNYALKLVNEVDIPTSTKVRNIPTINIVKYLIINSLRVECNSKGMEQSDHSDPILYFPNGLFPDNKLHFTDYKNRKNWFLAVGERQVKSNVLGATKYRYHVGFQLSLVTKADGTYYIALQPSPFISNIDGKPVGRKLQSARTKKVLKTWFNDKILNRQIGIIEFLSGNLDHLTIDCGEGQRMTVSSKFVQLNCETGIDEARLSGGNESNVEPEEDVDLEEEDEEDDSADQE